MADCSNQIPYPRTIVCPSPMQCIDNVFTRKWASVSTGKMTFFNQRKWLPGKSGYLFSASAAGSGRVPGIAPRHPPTPPDVRFSASGGWSIQRSSVSGARTGDAEHSDRLGAFGLRPIVSQSRVVTAVVAPCCFVRSFVIRSSTVVGSVRSFGPSHRDAFSFVRPSTATTASADFPPPLGGGISPGQSLFCPLAPLGSTECRQWLSGFVFASTLAPDILPRNPFVFLRSSVGLPPFRAGSLRRRPGGSATVGATSPRREPFIPQEQTPAGHTSAGHWPVSPGDSPGGMESAPEANKEWPFAKRRRALPVGGSPTGTGGSPRATLSRAGAQGLA